MPGQTTLAEARQHLASTFAQSSEYQLDFASASADTLSLTLRRRSDLLARIEITLVATKSRVMQIYFQFPVDGPNAAAFIPTVADLYSQLGIPSRLYVGKVSYALAFGQDMCRNLVVPDTGTALRWHDLASDLLLCQQISESAGHPWRGFVPLQRYFQ
ncbi:MAG TPA: hypothetical protein VMT34_08240 [Aggregatilineales bacterium]|nr:hypothetical protein [Aggregatilineales bacterium]